MALNFDKYKRRVGYTNIQEDYKETSKKFSDDTFEMSPSYVLAKLNNVNTGLLLTKTDDYKAKEVLFKPDEDAFVGDYIDIDTTRYLSTQFNGDGIYPVLSIKVCNNVLRWKDSLGDSHSYECVLEGSKVELDNDGAQGEEEVILSNSDLKVLIPYNNHTVGIKADQRFVINSKAYKVDKIDDITQVLNGRGLIGLGLTATSTVDSDDTTDNVADDSTSGSGWGSDW